MEQRNAGNQPAAYEPYGGREEIDWRKATRMSLFGVWSVARIVVIFISSLLIVTAAGLFAYQYVDSHYLAPMGAEEAPPQEIIVAKGMSITKIALLLEDKKLIRSSQVFKYLVDFSGYGGKMKAGSYVLDGSMTMQQIMEKLAQGEAAQQVTTFTITEGSTIEQMAAQLQKQGILKDTKKFLDLCKTGKEFTKYGFVKDLIASKDSAKRRYMLEGYLFPAKYEIYVDATEEDIITRMLDKTASLLTTETLARAQHQNMTVDQVLALASIIEKEGMPDDFPKISAVFYNRIKKDMRLDSDATTAYAVKKSGFNLTQDDIDSTSPYNTRKYKGFPLGPICNPSAKAIDAALNPDEQYIKDGYLYFYLTNPETGVVEFYKTQKEFTAGKDKYKDVWAEYNKKHGGN